MATRVRTRNNALTILRRAGLPAAALILMGFFGYYAVLGPNGVLSYRDYSRQLEKRRLDYVALDKRRAELRNRVALLDPRRANPDMVDELTRKELGVVHPDEVIVPLD
jgi:cell division protein FtsB